MEHFLLKDLIFKIKKISKESKNEKIDKLIKYAELINNENKKYNLTGFKSLDEIVCNLIIKSIDPIINLNVLRGTSFVDIGTGSGIPGVVLCILFSNLKGTLVEANSKKTNFIEMVKEKLSIKNITVVNERAEVVSKNNKYRNSFDFCITRAFGPLFYSYEFGIPMIKRNSFIYIYSNLKAREISLELKNHIKELGGSLQTSIKHKDFGLAEEGLLVIKNKDTPDKYPRKFPVIKREAARIPEVG